MMIKATRATKTKILAVLDSAANPYVALFALRLMLSSKPVRDAWYAAGYRFPWED